MGDLEGLARCVHEGEHVQLSKAGEVGYDLQQSKVGKH